MIRAMHSFVAKYPQYALMGGMGRKPLYLYELDDPKSIAWAEASVHERQPVALYDVRHLLKATYCRDARHRTRGAIGMVARPKERVDHLPPAVDRSTSDLLSQKRNRDRGYRGHLALRVLAESRSPVRIP
jgi:hypothetical protein